MRTLAATSVVSVPAAAAPVTWVLVVFGLPIL